MSKSKNRPPHLESKPGPQAVAPPPTLEALLERAHVAGRAAVSPGPSAVRRLVERAAGERAQPLPLDDAWTAVHAMFGATIEAPQIDAARTVEAARAAVRRLAAVAETGANIAFATSKPASLLPIYLAFARLARISGGDVFDDDEDSGPLRVDGRAARALRWIDGVAVVTDGQSLCDTRGPEAAAEWLFLIPRPALVVADGPYADAAFEAGIEVIALAGLDHCALAVGWGKDRRGSVVPMWTDRPPGAYRPLLETALVAAISSPLSNGGMPNGESPG